MLTFARNMLAAAALVALAPASARAAEPIVPGEVCDPNSRAGSWTRAQKRETLDRVWEACKAVGGSDTYCSWHLASVVRESSAVAVRVCTKGVDADGDPELGYGAYCLSEKFHAGKWPGDNESAAWCTPEAAFTVAHDIAWRAVERYGADDAVEIQTVFGGGRGSHACETTGYPDWLFETSVLRNLASVLRLPREERVCRATPKLRHVRSACNRMGPVACRRKLEPSDLGRKIPVADRPAWAKRQAARHRS